MRAEAESFQNLRIVIAGTFISDRSYLAEDYSGDQG
jgi:hypothetical protein